MFPLAVGTVILLVVGLQAGIRCCGSGGHGVHAAIVMPIVLAGSTLAILPLLLMLGGRPAGPGAWLWDLVPWLYLIGAAALGVLSDLAHRAIDGVRSMARIGEHTVHRQARGDPGRVARILEHDISIEAAVSEIGVRVSQPRTPIPDHGGHS